LTLACANLFELEGSALGLLKSAFNANNFYAVVLIYRQPFCRKSLLKCALQPTIAKNSPKPSFWRFKVTSVCYGKQHVCTYLQPFSHYTSPSDALVQGEPPHPGIRNFVTIN